MTSAKVAISIDNLYKRYQKNDEYALNGLSLTIYEGEFFGLLGPNGSGKTTLISILCGLLNATSGKVSVLGADVKTQLSKISHQFGYVPQEIALYPSLSLVQNLQLFGSLYGLKGAKLKQRLDFCLELSQLTAVKDKPIQTYSGGMKRWANLVAGLLHSPKVLFLDEPTTHVDPQSRHAIYECLQNLKQNGITIIYTTHYLEEATKLCSRLAIIKNGDIVALGEPDELVANTPNCNNLDELYLLLTCKPRMSEDSSC